ncbi:MAG: cyclic nucleotide-binding domain-containing protein [Deltaproteobacteria bacterium]|nr:cyclic nucleotide-binding domain-containing protein [Deltaproteobacteria bacterium]
MAESGGTSKSSFAWQRSLLFHFCDEEDWNNFLALSQRQQVDAGTSLWREGETGTFLYCLVQGHLEAVKMTPEWGKPIIIAEFFSGATVGTLPGENSSPHSTTLQVVEESDLICLSADAASDLMARFPATAARLWQGAAQLELCRLRQANQRLVTLF